MRGHKSVATLCRSNLAGTFHTLSSVHHQFVFQIKHLRTPETAYQVSSCRSGGADRLLPVRAWRHRASREANRRVPC